MVDALEQVTGPNLPPGFDTTTVKPLDYFELLFKPEMFEEIVAHANTYMGAKRAKKCKWHLMHKDVMPRKETRYGCKLYNVHLCKDGCHYAYHHGYSSSKYILKFFLFLFFKNILVATETSIVSPLENQNPHQRQNQLQ